MKLECAQVCVTPFMHLIDEGLQSILSLCSFGLKHICLPRASVRVNTVKYSYFYYLNIGL